MEAFAITESAYTKRRDLFAFCRWVDGLLRATVKHPHFFQSYFEQKERLVKKLLEEAIPIMRLGLHLYRAPTEVRIACTVGNEPYDGVIELRTPSLLMPKRRIKVEVTTTEDYGSALMRELLAHKGFAHSGQVRRDGEQIINEVEVVDVDEREQAIKAHALQRLKKKVESGKYGGDTAILVYVTKITSASPVSLSTRAELVDETWRYLAGAQADLAGVFFCYEDNQAVDEIESWFRSKNI